MWFQIQERSAISLSLTSPNKHYKNLTQMSIYVITDLFYLIFFGANNVYASVHYKCLKDV